MSYKVRLSDNAEEEIKLLQNPIRRRVINALRRLAEKPRSGKPLKCFAEVGHIEPAVTVSSTK